jgi:hypothetical protein
MTNDETVDQIRRRDVAEPSGAGPSRERARPRKPWNGREDLDVTQARQLSELLTIERRRERFSTIG